MLREEGGDAACTRLFFDSLGKAAGSGSRSVVLTLASAVTL